MSQAIIHNLTRNHLTPRGALSINRAPEGLVTATADFTCHSTDLSHPLIQNKLAKNTSIGTLYPQIGTAFAFLTVDNYTSRDEPGGYTVVTVSFRGVEITGSDTQFESDDVTFTRNASLREESIFNHPKFKSEVPEYTRETIRLATLGLTFAPIEDSLYDIRYTTTQETRDNITDPVFIKWYQFIVTEKNLTYNIPSSEWTKSATGKAKLRDSDLALLGKIDPSPPGNPSAPAGDVWMLSGATENIQIQGDGVNSFSLTWSSGDWPAIIYSDDPTT